MAIWRWLGAAVVMWALACPAGAVAPGVDTAWREHDRDLSARAWQDPAEVRKQAQAEAQAARKAGDRPRELRALADYLSQAVPFSEADQSLATRTAEHAREAGQFSTLFDLVYTLGQNAVIVNHPSAGARVAELAQLADQLGDPARQAVVKQLRALQAMYVGRGAEAIQLLTEAEAGTVQDFRRAEVLLMRVDAAVMSNPSAEAQAARDAARVDLLKAIELVNPEQYRMFGLQSLSAKGRIETASQRLDEAIADLSRALRLAPESMRDDREIANLRMSLAHVLITAGRPKEAAPVMDGIRSTENFGPADLFALAKQRALIYMAIGGPAADAAAQQWLDRAAVQLERLGGEPRLAVGYYAAAAEFYERTGQSTRAIAALKAANKATVERAQRANEKQRLELQTKLDVAGKERENAALRSQAQLEAERRLRWTWAFGMSAVGAASIGVALWVSMRRKRRLAEVSAELAKRNQQLEERSSSRIKLLAAACHDLRQPAHALGLLAELGVDAVRDPARSRTWLQNIRRCSATLTDMLGELMDLSRLDGGHYAPAIAAVSLDEILHDVRLQYGEAARQKQLAFDAPPCGLQVRSDRQLLRRIVFNLVSNAVKYTPLGGVTVAVELRDGVVALVVADTGPGIPPHRLDEVFQDYVRLEPLHAAEGLGIGLSIVRRAAELLGHSLHLDSTLGVGTRVTLMLGQPEAGGSTDRREAQAPRGDGSLIAMLENDAAVRDAMAAVLQRWGYTVAAAASVEELRSRCAPGDIRLLVTDLHLDRHDGLELVAEVRAWAGRPDLPALLVTGDLDAAVATRAAALGVFVAHKPLPPGRMLALVAQVLRPVHDEAAQDEPAAGVKVRQDS